MRGVLRTDMKMKNAAKAAGAGILSLLMLSSCARFSPDFRHGEPERPTTESHISADDVLPPAENGDYGKQASEIADNAIRSAIDLLNRHPAGEMSSDAPPTTPRRDRLPESVRGIYDMLFTAVEGIDKYEWNSVQYGETAFSDFMTADEALRADYPRFRAYYYPDVTGDVFRPLYFLPGTSYDNPTDDTAEILSRMSLFDAVSARIVSCMPDGLSDSGKYRYLAAVITGLCEYDSSLSTVGLPYPAYNALVNGSAVCSGYASALEHLCGEVGLFCQRIDGTKSGGDHAWNRICLAGSFYYCDLTAADAAAPGSDAWLQCIAITSERAKKESYFPFRSGITADGTEEIR